MKKLKRAKGFTLIEVMIVVAIVGIMAAVGIPSYRNYVLKTNRKAAIADMQSVQQRLERAYTQSNGAYPAAAFRGAVGVCNAASQYTSPSTGSPKYRLAVVITNFTNPPANTFGQGYTVTATPCGSQARESCGTLVVNHLNQRRSSTNRTDCFR